MAHIFLYVYYFLIGRQIKALTFSKEFDMITHSHKKLVSVLSEMETNESS